MQQHNQQEQMLITYVSGAILSFRIQEFPSRSTSEQAAIIQQIQHIFAGLSELTLQGIRPDWWWINYHDGSFTFFLRDNSGRLPSDTQLIVCLALAIALKLYEKKWQYTLTIALHWGDDVQIVGDRGSLQAFNGQTLSVTHHIVSFVESSPILIASQAFEKIKRSLFRGRFIDSCEHFVSTLKQTAGNALSFLFPSITESDAINEIDRYFLASIMLLDHQQQKAPWWRFAIEDAGRVSKVGNRSLPMEQVPMGIYDPEQHHAQQIGAINSDLVEQLIWSDEIVLIGPHYHLVDSLDRALKERRQHRQQNDAIDSDPFWFFWRKLQIVYPKSDNVQGLIGDAQMIEEFLRELDELENRLDVFLAACIPQRFGRWECLDCRQDLSFIGSRCKRNGQEYIRFAPLLLGCDPRNTIQLTIGNNIALYDQISHAIDSLVLPDARIRYAAPRTEWELVGKYDQDQHVFRYQRIINSRNIEDVTKDLAFPNVLIVLYVKTSEGTCVVLQERTRYNAINDFGIYSNIAGRLCTDDANKSLYPGRFWRDPDTKSVIATEEFNEFSNYSEGDVLDERVWRRAAVRELKEELGLDIDIKRLEERSFYYLERENANLFFQIFSLKLRQDPAVDELMQIEQRRSKAALKQYRLSELWHLYNEKKLNRLLQSHFKDLFLPLFEQIQITP